jgi:D-alanyl-D-alanine carboxypeptidase
VATSAGAPGALQRSERSSAPSTLVGAVRAAPRPSHSDALASMLARSVAARAVADSAAPVERYGPGDREPMSSSELGTFGSPWETALRREIFELETKWAMSSGRKPFWALADSDLETIEGVKLHKDAVSSAWAMLEKARFDLKTAKARGKPEALRVSKVGIASGYRRGHTDDFKAWTKAYSSTYGTRYNKRKEQGREKEPFTAAETSELRTAMINNKAVPGFSNHTRGTAIDFSTTEGNQTLGPSRSDSAAWRVSWFYNWLMTNAYKFGWNPLSTEEWHFDFKELTPEEYRACWCGSPEAHSH